MPRIVVRQKLRFKAQFLCKGCLWVRRTHVGHESFLIQQQKCFIFFKFNIWFTSCAKISRPIIIPCLYTLNKYIFHQQALEWDIQFRPDLRTERKVSGKSASNYGHVTCDRREQILTNGPGAADVCRLWHLSPPQLLLPEPRTHALMEPMTVPNAVPLVN